VDLADGGGGQRPAVPGTLPGLRFPVLGQRPGATPSPEVGVEAVEGLRGELADGQVAQRPVDLAADVALVANDRDLR
jgi:hypothetical protein